MSRLLLASNRLPVTVRMDHGRPRIAPSAGGLATGMRRLLEDGSLGKLGGAWIGWPGLPRIPDETTRNVVGADLRAMGLQPLWLGASEVRRYYEGFANGVLWPLFHDQLDRIPLDAGDWAPFVRVNARFAESLAAALAPGDTAWVHDYQLCLVPGMLRARCPDVAIGYFLHIPFPGSEVLRTLPWRRQVLEGMLGADLVGFHTETAGWHFREACARLLGAEVRGDRVRHAGRSTQVGAFPMGVDVAAWERLGAPTRVEVTREDGVPRIAHDHGREVQRSLLGVDRLDYTKGLPRRILAFERLLQRHPEVRGRVRLVQIAVPSREGVRAYQELRRKVEGFVGAVNGRYGTEAWTPIQYIGRGLSAESLAVQYRAADVMLVTPLRDGMNLVAKEFCATRTDEDGVLVLSELAGAAEQLTGALLVNPYDVEGMAATYARALAMPPRERTLRMQALRRAVAASDVHLWAESFLDALRRGASCVVRPAGGAATSDAEARLLARVRAQVAGVAHTGGRLALLLDHDGTLVPFAERPELAAPDVALLELLGALRHHADVHIVSGRPRADLDAWYGHLGLGLHAEHGLWSRLPGAPDWTRLAIDAPDAWMEIVAERMRRVAALHPAAFVETKSASLALHWRMAPAAASEVAAVHQELRRCMDWLPIDVLEGSRVLEVRPRGVHKGRVLAHVRADAFLALGDDPTDEALFLALPPGGIALRVGAGDVPTAARDLLPDPAAARRLLAAILDELGVGAPA